MPVPSRSIHANVAGTNEDDGTVKLSINIFVWIIKLSWTMSKLSVPQPLTEAHHSTLMKHSDIQSLSRIPDLTRVSKSE